MKNLTDEQISSLIKTGTLPYKSEDGQNYDGSCIFLSEIDSSSLPKFPEKFKKLVDSPNGPAYLAPDCISLFSSDAIIHHKKIFLSWLQAATLFNSDKNDCTKKQNLLKVGRQLISLADNKNIETNILSEKFWNHLKFSYHDSIAKHSQNFSDLFENNEDIIKFQDILPYEFKKANTNTRKNLDNNIMYYTYIKSVAKIAPDYSLPKVPFIITSRLQQSTSETCQWEVLNVLKKFHFSSTKHIIKKLYETSSRNKIVEKARAILLENNALDSQEQIILSEEAKTVHFLTLEINFLALKQKTNDNLFATKTLVNLIHNSIKSQFAVLKKDAGTLIYFEAKSLIIAELDDFKTMLTQYINYAFGVFLTPQTLEHFSESNKGLRVPHENIKNIQIEFKSGFAKFCLANKLNNTLELKNIKEKIKKI